MALMQELIRNLEAITREDIEALPPAERRQLADLLKHWSKVAERDEPKSGVLKDLEGRNGDC